MAAHGHSVTSAKRMVASGTRDPGLTGHPQLITCLENDNTLCPALLQDNMTARGWNLGPQSEPNNMLVFSLALPPYLEWVAKNNQYLALQRRWNQKHTHKSNFICVLLRDKLERKMPDAKKNVKRLRH